ncbi:acyltransferase family protein [Chryseosolibacter indicus]|uniref:Acyltransferase family protein n=1 Tax=Chryseosolibacter indicus TaxID=2782351 RepID=A0ABS5VX77_9BACT|nr:acyltransferase family protein [Chryseosolibacter indicus]MBT1705851.1 acyltransferase family protein [Chryseosolibacter indicus]
MQLNRRYDIDWVRVIAIGLLLIYHIAIGFQSWGIIIGFISNSKTWESLWIPMSMLNVWRIPLLFFVSGMGVYFALQNRNWKQLLLERTGRIFLPYLFGIFFIVPVYLYLWQYYYDFDYSYNPNPGHLWFLGNIFAYVLLLSPVFFYLKRNEDNPFVRSLKCVLGSPLGILLVIVAFMAEAWLVNPNPYTLYAMTWHGFFLGLIAFFFGFCFVLSGLPFWNMIVKWRWLFLSFAGILFSFRIVAFQQLAPNYLQAIESVYWVVSVLAFGYKYLNRPSKALDYLSQAAYPVYIIHMIFLYLGSIIIFPLDIPVYLQFALNLVFTFAGCFAFYELVIRRINIVRPLFGLKMKTFSCKPLTFKRKLYYTIKK